MVVNGELSCMVSGCAWAFSHVLLRSQESTVLWFCSLCNGTRAASSDNWVDSPWNAWACVHRRVLARVPVGNVVVNWSPILISEVGRGKGGIVL